MLRFAIFTIAAIALGGCANDRVVGGALIGGGAGAVVGGVATGNVGGAAAGAAIGAVGGAIVADATDPRPGVKCVRPGYDWYGNPVCFAVAAPADYHRGDYVVYYQDGGVGRRFFGY